MPSDYLLAGGDAEMRRLRLQAQVWEPLRTLGLSPVLRLWTLVAVQWGFLDRYRAAWVTPAR